MSQATNGTYSGGGRWFCGMCPELDVASQGDTIEAARDNLRGLDDSFRVCLASGVNRATPDLATSS